MPAYQFETIQFEALRQTKEVLSHHKLLSKFNAYLLSQRDFLRSFFHTITQKQCVTRFKTLPPLNLFYIKYDL